MNADLRQLLDLAVRVARLGGEATLRLFRTEIQVDLKPDGTVVTAADRESERLMREALLASCPADGILGEEFGETAGSSGFRWILDPLDGTIAFVRGSPLYGVIVGLQHEGNMVAGVIHMPVLGETVAAARGEGCFWNERRCHVSATTAIDRSFLVVTDDQAMRRARPGYARLSERAALVRTWGDCYGPILIATGRADVFLDNGLDLTDIGALQPIIEEAGGTLTDWLGVRTVLAESVLVTNGHIHREALKVLQT